MILYIKTDDIYKDIEEFVKIRSYTSTYELNRPLPKGKNANIIGLMKDELVRQKNMKNNRKYMVKFVRLKAKTYSYLIDDCI